MGGHEKPIEGVDFLKRGELGQFADISGAWQERGGGVFEGGLIYQCNFWVVCNTFELSFEIKLLNV